jgi:hypothetical protein
MCIDAGGGHVAVETSSQSAIFVFFYGHRLLHHWLLYHRLLLHRRVNQWLSLPTAGVKSLPKQHVLLGHHLRDSKMSNHFLYFEFENSERKNL